MSSLKIEYNFMLKSRWFDLLWLTILIAFVNFFYLGSVPLTVPDEGRYAEIAREMLSTHQYIIPHLDGIFYFEKPPLSYWINAGLMSLFGDSEWTVRSGGALLGLLSCLATYLVAYKLYNRRIAILSALILSSCALHLGMSHILTTDMPLSFFLTLSLYAFLLAFQLSKGIQRDGWLWAAYFCLGLAVMTKGLIGIVFPGLIVLVWIAVSKQWRLLKNMRLFSGFIIVLSVTLPWLVIVQKQVPAFLNFYFIEQQFARYATGVAHHEMAFATYCFIFNMGLFPWVVWLPQSINLIWSQCRTDNALRKTHLYLLIWPAVIFIFFAGSHSILIPYILPVFPPLAILIAQYIDSVWLKKLNRNQQISVMFFSLINLILGIGFFLLPYFNVIMITSNTYYLLALAAIPVISGAIIAGLLAYYGSIQRVFMVMLFTTYLSLTIAWSISSQANLRSIKPLALKLRTLLTEHPNAKVVNYGSYHQDLPYYIKQLVVIVNWTNELTFGLENQAAAKHLLMDGEHFARLWHSGQLVYVVTYTGIYQQFCSDAQPKCYLLEQTTDNVLISNQNPQKQ